MMKDRYMRTILTIIAVSLAILAVGTLLNLVTSSAQAQRPYNTVIKEGPAKDVLLIRDLPIENIKEVYVLGDTQTFIVRKSDGVAVYRVEDIQRN